MIGFIYPLILIGFCTIYAIQTRKCPGGNKNQFLEISNWLLILVSGFNEARYIVFTNYTIIIIWLCFLPLYITSTSNGVRAVTLAISLSLRYTDFSLILRSYCIVPVHMNTFLYFLQWACGDGMLVFSKDLHSTLEAREKYKRSCNGPKS